MSYLAIARKYRPVTFDEIVGQEHVTRTLRNAIATGRIHHAYLFTGARGVGKTTAARALARSLSCAEGPTATPCGVCTSCLEVLAGTSPDLIEIDGASNNSVEDVREIREAVQYAPTRGRWKVYLVDEVHMLSKAAFNALLKTLEEPPPHVVFIFATTEPNKIPDTILSRVQRFDFKRIPGPSVVGRLREIATAEGVSIPDEGLRLIARAGEGSMRDAQSLLDQVIAYGGAEITVEQVIENLGLIDRSLLHDMLAGLLEGRPDRCLAVIERVYSYGYELSQFTGELLELLRDATFLRLTPKTHRHVDLPAEEIEQLGALTADVDGEVLGRLFTALLETHDQVARSSRPRIILEMAVARLATVRPLQPFGELVGRLQDLERGLRGRGSGAGPSGMRRRGPSGPPNRAPARAASPPPPAGRRRRDRRGPPEPEASALFSPSSSAPDVPVAEPPSQTPPPAPQPGGQIAPHDQPPGERWDALCDALHNDTLRRALVRLDAGKLWVSLPAGRPLAEARRLAPSEAFRSALRSFYGPDVVLELVELEPKSDVDPLTRRALENPDVQRLIHLLDARIARVELIHPEQGD